MKLNNFINEFQKSLFSTNTPSGKPSGKANSYGCAIKYLCDYLKISDINNESVEYLTNIRILTLNTNSDFYKNFYNYLEKNNKTSYITGKYFSAAIKALIKFYYYNSQSISTIDNKNDTIILEELRDSQIKINFSKDNLKNDLPIFNSKSAHTYSISKTYGTSAVNNKKIYSGRKAEKYVIEYLKYLGLIQGIDFEDVSNDKDYGFDLLISKMFGFEIKNIKSGNFYLSDNEIAHLENEYTHLLLVDIDNGIWLLKNNSKWLINRINEIKAIREYCSKTYSQLDLTDIRIIIDEKLKMDIINFTDIPIEKLKSTLLK